jgi:hypothetical protein
VWHRYSKNKQLFLLKEGREGKGREGRMGKQGRGIRKGMKEGRKGRKEGKKEGGVRGREERREGRKEVQERREGSKEGQEGRRRGKDRKKGKGRGKKRRKERRKEGGEGRNNYYEAHCPLSGAYLIYITFQKLDLFIQLGPPEELVSITGSKHCVSRIQRAQWATPNTIFT